MPDTYQRISRADAETLAESIRNRAADLAMADLDDLEALTREELIDLEVNVRQAARKIAPDRFGPDPTPAERVSAKASGVLLDEHGGWGLHPDHVGNVSEDPAHLSIRDRALRILSAREYADLGESHRLRIATRAARAAAYDVSTSELSNEIDAIIEEGE